MAQNQTGLRFLLALALIGCGGSTADGKNATPDHPAVDAGASGRDAAPESGGDEASPPPVGNCNGRPFDPIVAAGIRVALERGATDLESITTLTASGAASLDGLQCLTNLEVLVAFGGTISDISPLRDLAKLESVSLGDNRITDLLPLSGHEALRSVRVERNRIATVQGLVLPEARCNYTLNVTGNPVPSSELTGFCDLGWVVTWGAYGDAGEEYCNLPCL